MIQQHKFNKDLQDAMKLMSEFLFLKDPSYSQRQAEKERIAKMYSQLGYEEIMIHLGYAEQIARAERWETEENVTEYEHSIFT